MKTYKWRIVFWLGEKRQGSIELNHEYATADEASREAENTANKELKDFEDWTVEKAG